jgi:hypothetical protein
MSHAVHFHRPAFVHEKLPMIYRWHVKTPEECSVIFVYVYRFGTQRPAILALLFQSPESWPNSEHN